MYTKDRLISGKPTGVGFYEEYPDHASAWTYSNFEADDSFDYNDNELDYKTKEPRDSIKKHLDELHIL